MVEAEEKEEGDDPEDGRGRSRKWGIPGNSEPWRVCEQGREETELCFEDIPCGC